MPVSYTHLIKEDTVKMLLTVQIKTQEEPKREAVMKPATNQSGDGSAAKEPVRKKKIGRNDPCPCGSGKKYKKCCGRFEN